MHPKSDDSPGELIHDNHDPVGFQENGFAPEQIDAPEAIFHMADEGEPGGSISGLWVVALGEDAPHYIFVDVDAKGSCDLLSDSGTSEPRILALHLKNKLDELWRWALGPWLAASSGRVEQPIFSILERLMKSKDRRWPDGDG